MNRPKSPAGSPAKGPSPKGPKHGIAVIIEIAPKGKPKKGPKR